MNDSHAHLTIEPISLQLERALSYFKEIGGKKILNVSHDIESIEGVVSVYNNFNSKYPDTILNSIGIHPEYFTESKEDFLESGKKAIEYFIEKVQKNIKILSAIGETGLDYHHFQHLAHLTTDQKLQLQEIQRRSFIQHIEIALKNDLPLSIHTRDIEGQNSAIEDAIGILSESGKGSARGSFHSYTGDIRYLNNILDLGFFVGFNGIITYPGAGNVRDILKATPIEKVLVETDTPLLPPQSIRKNKKLAVRYGRPSDISEIIDVICEVKDIKREKCTEILDENFNCLF